MQQDCCHKIPMCYSESGNFPNCEDIFEIGQIQIGISMITFVNTFLSNEGLNVCCEITSTLNFYEVCNYSTSKADVIPYNEIQCPPKVLGQFVKLTKSQYSQNSSIQCNNNQFSTKLEAGNPTIWIQDQAPRFVGPDLDPYYLQRSFQVNISL